MIKPSNVDHLEAFQVIIDKPQYVATFKSLEGEIREMFVHKLLRKIKGDWKDFGCMPLVSLFVFV